LQNKTPRLALWQRNLWSVVVAEILAILAFQAGAILIPYYIQQMGITDLKEAGRWTGAYQSIGAVAFAIATPIWGAMGDRYGRKLMLVRAMAATSVVFALTGLARTPIQLLAIRAVQGCFTGTPAAASALVAAGTPRERLAYGLGLVQTSLFIGTSLGPMFGGYIGDTFGYRATFYAAAGVVALALIVVILWVQEPAESAATAAKARGENPIAAFKSLLGMPALLWLIAMTLAINMTASLMGPVLPLYIQELATDSSKLASIAGTITGISALTAAISALVIGRMSDRIGHRRTLLGCTIGVSALYFPAALARSIASLRVVLGIQGFFQGGISPSISAMVVNTASKDKAGVALGLNSSAASIGFAIGPMLGAAILALSSARVVYLVAGCLYVLVTIGIALVSRRAAAKSAPAPQAAE